MAHYNHSEATGPVAVAYPPPPASYSPLPALTPGHVNSSPLPQSYPPPSVQAGYRQSPCVAPPVAYPVKNELPLPQQPTSHSHPQESKHRGDGFWRGCCAALCCCCLLDMCF